MPKAPIKRAGPLQSRLLSLMNNVCDTNCRILRYFGTVLPGRGPAPPWRTSNIPFLYLQQLLDAAFGQGGEGVHAGAAEGAAFAGSLYFNKLVFGGHYDVEIDIGAGVFLVAEIEQDFAAYDADADGCDRRFYGMCCQDAAPDKLRAGAVQGDIGSGDGGSARAAVRLENIAVEGDSARSQRLPVHYGAQGASDEALDLLRAPADAAFSLTRAAGMGGARQHAVFCCDPA